MSISKYIFTALLLAILVSPAMAKDTTVTYALFSRGWPPFEFVELGKEQGVAVDLFRELMPEDVQIEVKAYVGPRKFFYHEQTEVFARLEAMEWMRKTHSYVYTEPVLSIETVLYSPAANPFEFDDINSLNGKTIGCIKQYVYPKLAPLFKSGKAKRYDVNSDKVLLRMVKEGRVDVAVLDSTVALWLISKMPDISSSDFHVAKKPLQSVGLRFVFNKNGEWEKRLPELNQRIERIQQNGTIERILTHYR